MQYRNIDIYALDEVAAGLKELKNQMIFVGGAVVSLYTDDEVANEIRPTEDIDLTINLLNYKNWTQMQERLSELGFYPDPFGHTICRYKYKGIAVDIMPADDSELGPSNKWYSLGFNDLLKVNVGKENIQILPAPCYLSTKFEAFKDRGSDYRTSHDIEDIIHVFDNRANIVEEILHSDKRIFQFLKEELLNIKSKGLLEDVLLAHMPPLLRDKRLPIVVNKINRITNS